MTFVRNRFERPWRTSTGTVGRMGLFEQRISAEQVAAARAKIAAGGSLRAAAAEIPCAPSTLSVRIKKAEAAEDEARIRAGLPAREPAEAFGPVEVLRGALNATKANGQPDWAIRVSAARALAALRPEEVDPEPKDEPEAEANTIVYDLPPGSSPILHRAPPPPFAPKDSKPPPAPPVEPGTHFLERGGDLIPLVRHAAEGSSQVHVLHDHQAAAEIIRAFGGDPRFLDTTTTPPPHSD
jgi:hypothetical protein